MHGYRLSWNGYRSDIIKGHILPKLKHQFVRGKASGSITSGLDFNSSADFHYNGGREFIERAFSKEGVAAVILLEIVFVSFHQEQLLYTLRLDLLTIQIHNTHISCKLITNSFTEEFYDKYSNEYVIQPTDFKSFNRESKKEEGVAIIPNDEISLEINWTKTSVFDVYTVTLPCEWKEDETIRNVNDVDAVFFTNDFDQIHLYENELDSLQTLTFAVSFSMELYVWLPFTRATVNEYISATVSSYSEGQSVIDLNRLLSGQILKPQYLFPTSERRSHNGKTYYKFRGLSRYADTIQMQKPKGGIFGLAVNVFVQSLLPSNEESSSILFHSYNDIGNTESLGEIKVTDFLFSDQTTIKTISINDLVLGLLRKINPDITFENLLNNWMQDIRFTSGLNIRGYPDKGIKISLKKLLEELDKLCAIGHHFDGKKFQLRLKQEYYNRTVTGLEIQVNSNKVTLSVDRSNVFKSFSFGLESVDNENIPKGKFFFKPQRWEVDTPVLPLKKFKKVSSFIISQEAIDYLLTVPYTLDASASTDFDDKLFLLHTTSSIIREFGIEKENNLVRYSPEEISKTNGLMFFPTLIFLRHWKFLQIPGTRLVKIATTTEDNYFVTLNNTSGFQSEEELSIGVEHFFFIRSSIAPSLGTPLISYMKVRIKDVLIGESGYDILKNNPNTFHKVTTNLGESYDFFIEKAIVNLYTFTADLEGVLVGTPNEENILVDEFQVLQ